MQPTGDYNPFRELHQKIISFFATFAGIGLKFKAFGEQEEKNKVLYLRHGWFPFPHIPIRALGCNINSENIDTVMVQEIENALGDIESDIYHCNPERKKILQEAFWAHRNERYALSIPVFLSQADGIAAEVKNVSAFSRKIGSRLIDKVEFDKEQRFISDIWFEVLLEDCADIRARSENVSPNALNRHAVLHGLSAEYPTKINSSKAISFLSGINWLLKAPDN